MNIGDCSHKRIEWLQNYLTYRASFDLGFYSYDISLCAFDKSYSTQLDKNCLIKQKQICDILKIINKLKKVSVCLTNFPITNTIFKYLYKCKILWKTILKYCWFEFSILLVLPQNVKEIEWKMIGNICMWFSKELKVFHATKQDFSKNKRNKRIKQRTLRYLSLKMVKSGANIPWKQFESNLSRLFKLLYYDISTFFKFLMNIYQYTQIFSLRKEQNSSIEKYRNV